MVEDDLGELRRQEAELVRKLASVRSRITLACGEASSAGRSASANGELLAIAVEKTRMAMILTDPNLPDNPIVFVNRAFQELCGYDADELIGRNCRFLQGPDTNPSDVAKIRDAIAARRDEVVEILNYDRTGKTFRNELYLSPVFDEAGRLRYFFASQLDVTRFRTEEVVLSESEARYRALFEGVDAGFCIVDMRFDADGRAVDYRFVETNPAFERNTGLSDATGRWVSGLVPDLEAHWFETYGAVALTGTPARFESGSVALGRWFDVHAMRLGDPVRRRVAILFNDITARRMAEDASVAEAAQRTRERDTVWVTSRDLLAVCRNDGIYRAVNPAWTECLGWGTDEVVGARFDRFVHPDDMPEAQEAFERLGSGGRVEGLDLRLLTARGDYRSISWTGTVEGGEFYAAGRDVTERKALEEQLRQSQKLEAIGQLTGGVAHDFNNLLTVIKSSTDLLKRPDLTEERRLRYVGAISDTVDRAAKLTDQLLAFARRQSLKPEVFDVGHAVNALGEMVGTLTGSRIRVSTKVDAGQDASGSPMPCLIDADPSQFDTAVINMAVNARDAMNGEGILEIRVAHADAIPAVRAHGRVDGDFVLVSVSDTGSGIAPGDLERVFEPFFTTKGVGQGTGLGLSQVFGFAKQSGGDILVVSEVGVGTTFSLYLPRAAAGSLPDAADCEPIAFADGHGTGVLIVEDNPEVGAFAEQALRELGYRTVWAIDAAQALAEIERMSRTFDVVFSDVIMPGMNGVELAREIRRRRPDMPVVLTSGYSNVLAQEGTHGFDLLRKPYSVDELSGFLTQAIARARAAARR